MLPEKLEKALNEQLNLELYSAYLYMGIAAYFEQESLKGFAEWNKMQTQEELFHAQKFYNYILDRGGNLELNAIDKPKSGWTSSYEAFKAAAEHEGLVTKSINNLAAIARESADYATESFLQWFINEQVEEEANVNEIVGQLKQMQDAPGAVYMLNKELGQRPAPVNPNDAQA